MRYVSHKECEVLFLLIRKRMSFHEPAPPYENEQHGQARLRTILHFARTPGYRGVLAKASYLFCSTIGGHPFSNGNKRLAVILVAYFFVKNGYQISIHDAALARQQLKAAFPHLRWRRVRSFERPAEHFLYHLAMVIADRTQKGNISFQDEQYLVKELFRKVAKKA